MSNMITFLHRVKTKKLVVVFSLQSPSIRIKDRVTATRVVFACVTHCSFIDPIDTSKSVFLAGRS